MGLFSRDPDADDEPSLLEGRGFVLSAIIVGAVVVCGVAILLLGRGSDTPASGPTQEPSVPVTPEPTDGPTDVPTEGPATPDPTQPTSRSASPRWVKAICIPAMITEMVAAAKARYITLPCMNATLSVGVNVTSSCTIGIVGTRTQMVPTVPTMNSTALDIRNLSVYSKASQMPLKTQFTRPLRICVMQPSSRLRMLQSGIITRPGRRRTR